MIAPRQGYGARAWSGEANGVGERRRNWRRRPASSSGQCSASSPSTVLGEEQTHEVHRLSMRILSEIGLTFHAQSAWDTLEANGCAVDRETGNVRFDPAVVEHFVAMAPGAFDMAARDPAKTVHFGGDSIVGIGVKRSNVLDQERGRRPGTGADFQELLRLGHMIPSLHVMGGTRSNRSTAHRTPVTSTRCSTG